MFHCKTFESISRKRECLPLTRTRSPRVTTVNNDPNIPLTALRDTSTNMTQVQKQFLLKTRGRTSSQTIRNRLQYNAKRLTPCLVGDFLEAEIIQNMECPECLPDHNPIERVWNTLRR
ncbi:hypothetical protein TNCV_3559651 [Trichonephila clavipes]|uniref:Uncharacterized protein n=1 Tax=Trichonephila clavipes TaxID=2585209 RepID=A0A8X6WDA6_TRICX|nr:hypothetical protein TNCV_3559651 [Trichonephila clavipes]